MLADLESTVASVNDELRRQQGTQAGSTSPGDGAVRHFLRLGDHDVELFDGEILVGRSPKCQLVLDDPMVSRRHARLVVRRGTVTVEDMGSVNGVLVNGERLQRARVLRPGDRVVIGQHAMELYVAQPSPSERPERDTAKTLSGATLTSMKSFPFEEERSEATRQGDAFAMLTGVVEKVLTLGRGDEAERILGNYLRNLLQSARAGSPIDEELASSAVSYAVRIADATKKGAWVDYVFELYTVLGRPLPGPLVERLYTSLRSLTPINLKIFRQYLATLKMEDTSFGPTERFVVRRIEGLEKLAMR